MKIFNTLTRNKDTFESLEEKKVKIYSCGPTVYNYFHLGNARPFVTFDTLRRYLTYQSYEVVFVQNFTDIDDKMIREANAEGITVKELADRYIKEYQIDAEGLGVLPATFAPRATETIEEMIQMIEKLIENEFAYVAEDGVYFSVNKFPAYAKLSKFNLDDLIENARQDLHENSGKKASVDFVLWKFQKEDSEPAWKSPWGDGRPGWHIECSAMAKKYLGDTIDIHCGGKDLVFPHHENEIAQSEAANGKEFARYWMHNGFITVDNHKMSKSEGNFFTVREIAEKYSYMPIRLFLLNSHYRSPINYSIDLIEQVQNAWERIVECVNNLRFLLRNAEGKNLESHEQQTTIEMAEKKFVLSFESAMDDDLNTAEALASVFDFIRVVNTEMANVKDYNSFASALEILEKILGVLGLRVEDTKEEIAEEVLELVEKRVEAKKAKDFALADALREQIQALGYQVVDTAQGPKLEKL